MERRTALFAKARPAMIRIAAEKIRDVRVRRWGLFGGLNCRLMWFFIAA
jgi:hypothetical protein